MKPEVLKWLYETQEVLKKKFDLDTTRREDMGRIKLNQPYQESDSGERNVLPYGTPIDGNGDCKVANMYACAHRRQDDCGYSGGRPLDAKEEKEWQLNVQQTFRVVVNDSGELELDISATSMNEEDLEKLYENAKDGRIYVNSPGVDILSADKGCAFLCVSKDDKPVLYDGGLKNFNVLPKEKQEHFLKNHPDITIRKPGDPRGPGYYDSNDKELLEIAMKEETELADVENPDIVMNHVEQGLTAVQNETTIGEKNTRYDAEFWYDVHHGLPTLNRDEDTLLNRTLKDALVNEVDIDSDFLMGQGLENFFVEEVDGSMVPLFPDHQELKEAAEREAESMSGTTYRTGADVGQTLLEAMKAGPVYVYGPGQGNPNEIRAAELRLRRDGKLQTTVVRQTDPEPTKPSWYKRLLNAVNSNWYKEEMDQYRRDKAAHQEAQRHRENAEVARRELLDEEAAQREADSPRRQELLRKNAEAIKFRNVESFADRVREDCLSDLMEWFNDDKATRDMGDTFTKLMFVNDLEKIMRSGTEDAKGLLQRMKHEDLSNLYQNVYMQMPEIKNMVESLPQQPQRVSWYLGEDLYRKMADPDKTFGTEDLYLAGERLTTKKNELAKSHKIKTIDLGKALNQEAKKLKAEQVKKPTEKVKEKTAEKSGNVLGG